MLINELLDKAGEKLGKFAGFLPAIGEQLKIAIKEGNADKIRARTKELREAGEAQIKFANQLDAHIADNVENGVELVEDLRELDEVLDQWEDVFKGYDEDDEPPATPATP